MTCEINRPFSFRDFDGHSVRFFLPPHNSGPQPLWVCLEDMMLACGLQYMLMRVAVERIRDSYPVLIRIIRHGADRLHAANWRSAHEILMHLEVDGWVSAEVVNRFSATMRAATIDYICLSFGDIPPSAFEDVEVAAFANSVWASCAEAESILPHVEVSKELQAFIQNPVLWSATPEKRRLVYRMGIATGQINPEDVVRYEKADPAGSHFYGAA